MNRRLLLLGSAALVLTVVLLLDRGWPPPPETQGPSPPAVRESAKAEGGRPAGLNPLEGLAAENFTVMLERPLFNPGRAARPPELPPEPPPPVAEPAPEPPPEPAGPLAEDFVLVAVAAGSSGRVAAVRIAATGEVLYLREGQPVQAWDVVAIRERSVVIGTPESSVEVFLFDTNETGVEGPVPEPTAPGPGAELPGQAGVEQIPPEATEPLLDNGLLQ